MIEVIRFHEDSARSRLNRVIQRSSGITEEILSQTARIVSDVRHRGDEALFEYTEKFDAVSLTLQSVRATSEIIRTQAAKIDSLLLKALREAIVNVRNYHENQKENSWEVTGRNGVTLGQRISPLEIVGLYVPGGKAAYPSTVIMNAVPAQVAGVSRLVVVTPYAQFEKNPVIAAVIAELGIEEVYLIGGAQAVAALAYGTESIPRVDKIVGPGNQYVAAAKKIVYGDVDIDSIAGPSEIVILADSTARPDFVAADLLSQAEHSEDAAAILVTESAALAEKVAAEVERQLQALTRKEIVVSSLADYGAIVVVDSIEEGAEFVNRLAPEHLEIMTADDERTASLIKHAGAIFIGSYSAESVGDYLAGSNHVLPTGGTARFSSALGVYDFLKRTSIIRYTREELLRTAPLIDAFARAEGLDAHARAATIRVDG